MVAGWIVEATHALIALLGEHSVEEKLDGVSKNKAIYEKISASMREQGFNYDTAQRLKTLLRNILRCVLVHEKDPCISIQCR